MGTTIWFFIETGDGALKRFPAKKVYAFGPGTPLGENLGSEARFVEAIVEVAGRQVACVNRVCFPRFLLRPDGTQDRDHADQAPKLASGMIADFLAAEPGIVDLQPLLDGRRFRAEHQWQPSESQLQQVANALNRAAIRPPVVVVQAGKLLPV